MLFVDKFGIVEAVGADNFGSCFFGSGRQNKIRLSLNQGCR